jgi:hypothetical protein
MTEKHKLILTNKLNKFLNEEIYNDDIMDEVEDELDIYRFFVEYFQDTIIEG